MWARNGRLPRSIQECFTCRKSTTWDRRLYFPSEGRRAEDFFRPEKSDGFGRVWTRELGYQRPARYEIVLRITLKRALIKAGLLKIRYISAVRNYQGSNEYKVLSDRIMWTDINVTKEAKRGKRLDSWQYCTIVYTCLYLLLQILTHIQLCGSGTIRQ